MLWSDELLSFWNAQNKSCFHILVSCSVLLCNNYLITVCLQQLTWIKIPVPSFHRSADIVKHWTKQILVGLFIGTVTMQLIFTLTCSKILPFSQGLLFASIICSGLLFNGTIPLVFELIMECVFPVGEGTSVGMALILGNLVIFVFDAAFMFPMSDVQWMNWVSVGGIAVCVPLLLVYKSQYRRLDLDT